MKIKIFKQLFDENKLIMEEDTNIHNSNMYLSAKSIFHDDVLYDVLESVLNIKGQEIQITVEER